MAKLKHKTIYTVILLLLLPLFMGAEKKPITVPIIEEETYQRSRFKTLSVSPLDEVAIGFSSGVVYMYNAEGEFICGYQFPATDSAFSILFVEDNTIGYYLGRARTLRIYDRNGQLLKEENLEGRKDYDKLIETKRVDSNGIEYSKKNNKIWKIYPDGTQELFYEIAVQGNDVAAGVILVPIIVFFLGKQGMKLFASLKKS